MSEAMDFQVPIEVLEHSGHSDAPVPTLSLAELPLPLFDAIQLLGKTIQSWTQSPIVHSLHRPQLIHLRVPIRPVDPLLWLAHQPHSEKIYWSNRERTMVVAGVGVAHCRRGHHKDTMLEDWKLIQHLLHPGLKGVRFLGGMRFDRYRSAESPWQEWGAYSWTLPRFVLERSENTYTLNCAVLLEPGSSSSSLWSRIHQEWSTLNSETEPYRWLSRSSVIRRVDRPEVERWCALLKQTSSQFQEGVLEKIVWARETELELEEAPEPMKWLNLLREYASDTFLFFLQHEKENVFLGASPERLFSRSHRTISCDALAGTVARGGSLVHDEQLGKALLQSPKDRYEQKLVFDVLKALLQEVCEDVSACREPTLRKFQHVQHLWSPLNGTLREGVSDLDLLQHLHPTPAVGGRPTSRALEILAQGEPFDRGWYAAPVGWVGPQSSDFTVAIRSALVHQKQVRLYAGAGIVPDSVAEAEWQELEEKIKTFVGFFKMP